MADKKQKKQVQQTQQKKGKEEKRKETPLQVQTEPEEKVTPRLYEMFKQEIVPLLMKQFNYKNIMQVPRLHKITLNIGVGKATQDPKLLEDAVKDLELIAGQRPAIRKAKKSISNFKFVKE